MVTIQQETEDLQKFVAAAVQDSIEVKRGLVPIYPQIIHASQILFDTFKTGGKAILFGNGGSAADAQHLAAELVVRFYQNRAPLSALALTTNSSAITATANDLGYEQVFAWQLRGHARPGDVAVAISTSGSSPNVVEAARLKEELGIRLIALTGENSTTLAPYADVVVAVPARDVARIQEAHILIGHIMCAWVEKRLFG